MSAPPTFPLTTPKAPLLYCYHIVLGIFFILCFGMYALWLPDAPVAASPVTQQIKRTIQEANTKDLATTFSEQPRQITPPNKYTEHITTKKITVDTKSYSIKAFIPVTGNHTIDAEMLNWVEQRMATFAKEALEHGRPDGNNVLHIHTEYEATAYTFSFVLHCYEFLGGVHGNLRLTSRIYTKEGVLIDINDIFPNPSAALKELSTLSRANLTVSLGAHLSTRMLDHGTQPTLQNFQVIALAPQGIYIFFEPYQVAPWAAGVRHVYIPLCELDAISFNQAYW